MNFDIQVFDIRELNLIKSLWEELNAMHLEDSEYFKDRYRANTFEKRCSKFTSMNPADFLGYMVVDGKDDVLGYCISTVNRPESKGEIDSLFLKDCLRGSGYGSELVVRSVEWLKKNRCSTICVSVADGHESVFDFYMKQGFFPRLTYLELKEEK